MTEMYTDTQLDVMHLLGAGSRSDFDKTSMFALLETAVFGRGDWRRFDRSTVDSLPRMGDDMFGAVTRARAILDLDLPLKDGYDSKYPSFWQRRAANEFGFLVSCLGYEHFFPENFARGSMLDALNEVGLPEPQMPQALAWAAANITPGSATSSPVYAVLFDQVALEPRRIVESGEVVDFPAFRNLITSSRPRFPSL